MNVIERAKAILLQPAQTWPVIDAEPATVQSIYKDWLFIIAAIPVVCHFIGMTLIGVGGWGYTYRTPLLAGLVGLVVGYAVSLVAMFLLALLVDALAPTFGGTKNQVAAMKVVAYSMTASCVAGVLLLVPSMLLGLVVFAAACYGIYLFYLGLPTVMHTPEGQVIPYMAVAAVVTVTIAVMIVIMIMMMVIAVAVALAAVPVAPAAPFVASVPVVALRPQRALERFESF